MKIRLYPSIKKKPKEAAVEIQVMLEKVQLEKNGTIIFRVSAIKISDFLLFANPQPIGCGFVSPHVHFAALMSL